LFFFSFISIEETSTDDLESTVISQTIQPITTSDIQELSDLDELTTVAATNAEDIELNITDK
jgi:hypothetical protein